jgi:putative holliday junction resolvase
MQDRIIGLDIGEKRIGVAVSDPLGITAQGLPFIANTPEFFSELRHILESYECKTIVVGLPKDRDGNDSKKATEVRDFATQISIHCNVAIEFWDERYSTVAVNRHLIAADISRKKRKTIVDSQAAMFILQGYMDRLAFKRG